MDGPAIGPLFKHPLKLGAGSELSKSELKKCRANLPEQCSAILPLKGVSLQKQQGTKLVVFSRSTDRQPLFFHPHYVSAATRLFPSLFAVRAAPGLVCELSVSSAAAEALFRGSDLFRPGVHALCGPPLQKDAPCAVRVDDGPCEFVGVSLMSQEEFDAAESGAVFRPVHCVGDHLWRLGSADAIEETTDAAAAVDNEQQSEADKVAPVALTDDVVIETFVRGLKLFVKKADLPMLASTFYSKCMLPACKPGVVINLKVTRFKKLGPLLAEMEKEGLIKCSERSADVIQIDSVNKSAPLYRKFPVDQEEREAENPAPVAPAGPLVEILYTVPPKMQEFFKNAGVQDGDELRNLTKKEARDLLMRHVKQENGVVNVDEQLRLCLKGKGEETMKIQQLLQVWFDSLTCSHRIFVGDRPQIVKGLPKKVVIKERKKGNKNWTDIDGLAGLGLDLDQISSDLQKVFAASATVQEGTLSVQGSRASEVAELLKNEHRVPADLIECEKKQPKKKK